MWKIYFNAKHFEVQQYNVAKIPCIKEFYTHMFKKHVLQRMPNKPTCLVIKSKETIISCQTYVVKYATNISGVQK